ncbi:MAG: SUMF1/EgtB/PvdO family nonheme iron enzyme [Thiomargarita sp.]|nr:SUMF1/EgtB/PvdO family nonheme iron enzyme [Thiomargarita sp.]
MIKAFIITIIAGTGVGLFLLWMEYSYFAPVYSFLLEEPSVSISANVEKYPSIDNNDLVAYSSRPCLPGAIFRDKMQNGHLGPEMVIIPAGYFQMGNFNNRSNSDEQLVQWLFVNSFTMGRYEITFDEYDYFAKVTGRKKTDDQNWGRKDRPVINVSMRDAIAYVKWLNKQTNRHYRLPTEAEWEYAARAGNNSQYWWGNEMDTGYANCDGCGSRWDNKKTAPINSFFNNPFNLHDMLGNVYEWTCSIYEENPLQPKQYCMNSFNSNDFYALRGGSWYSLPKHISVFSRFRAKATYYDKTIGFRVVSSL